MKHVHDRKILHRDLKAQNVFLTKSNIIKLGDFGIARVLSGTQEHAQTMVGTPYYLSPEIINGKPYNFKSDIWSLGVLLYELCALKPPFDAKNLPFLALKIIKGQYSPIPTTYSKGLRELVNSLFKVNPRDRPTINTILNMPIIQDRIRRYLSETTHFREFSKTFLKNQVRFTL